MDDLLFSDAHTAIAPLSTPILAGIMSEYTGETKVIREHGIPPYCVDTARFGFGLSCPVHTLDDHSLAEVAVAHLKYLNRRIKAPGAREGKVPGEWIRLSVNGKLHKVGCYFSAEPELFYRSVDKDYLQEIDPESLVDTFWQLDFTPDRVRRIHFHEHYFQFEPA